MYQVYSGGSSPVISMPAGVLCEQEYRAIGQGQIRQYESPAHKTAEYQMVEYFASIFNKPMEVKTLSMYEGIDYSLHVKNDTLVHAVVECKSHNRAFAKTPTYILDLKNYERLKKLHEYNVTAYLLVGYTDGLYYWTFNPNIPFTIHAGGRTDRKDPHDIVLKTNFSTTYFTKIL